MVFGPVVLEGFENQDASLLIRYAQETEWIRLSDLRQRQADPENFVLDLELESEKSE